MILMFSEMVEMVVDDVVDVVEMVVLILMLSEMVERGGYTSLDLLDGDCVLRPQVIQYHRKQSAREVWMKKHKSLGFPCC